MVTAEAIAVVREALTGGYTEFERRVVLTDALAALALIEQRMEELERERDELAQKCRTAHMKRTRAEARIAQLEEALRQIVRQEHYNDDVQPYALADIARAALASGYRVPADEPQPTIYDLASGKESPFPKPRMVEIGEERASGKEAKEDAEFFAVYETPEDRLT